MRLLALAALLVACDDAGLAKRSVQPGPVAAPTLAADQALDFGHVIVGRTSTLTLHLTASGGTVTLAPPVIDGAGQRAFSTPNEALSIDGEATIAVTFAPHRLGKLSAALDFDGRVRVALSGEGVDACGPKVQRFTTPTEAPPKLDVLFVIDDSPSMTIGQAAIRQQISLFVQRLATQGLDYRMAVVTTSMNVDRGAGTLVVAADQKLKIAEGSSAVQDFQKILERVTTGGSDTELGLLAMIVALTPPDRTVSYNVASGVSASYQGFGKRDPAFWRDDARLAVIIVSDENDGGSNFGSTSSEDLRAPAAYAADLLALKPHPGANLRVVAIVDPGSSSKGCGISAASAGAPRYHAFMTALGPTIGSTFDYCSNFGTTMSVAGSFVAVPACHFLLQEAVGDPPPADVALCNAATCLPPADFVLLPPTAAEPNGSVEILRGCPSPGESVELRYSACTL